MSIFKGICTDYVSDIDKLFHAPDPSTAPISPARELEKIKAKRIQTLRDKVTIAEGSSPAIKLWEDF